MTKDPQVIAQWLQHIYESAINLTKWEEDFMESVAEQFEKRHYISDKQEEILERIYTDKTP